MAKLNSTFAALVVAAVAAGGIAFAVEHWRNLRLAQGASASKTATLSTAAPTPEIVLGAGKTQWSASAPGRVEPQDGLVRIGAQAPGKVTQVLVEMNDSVQAGDLLAMLDDDDALARVEAGVAEAAVRHRERDEEEAKGLAAKRRQAEDDAYQAERARFTARMQLDQLQLLAAKGARQDAEIKAARDALNSAEERVVKRKAALNKLQSDPQMPLPSRMESSLALARAELAVAEAGMHRTRIRAPSDGTILKADTHKGETVTPSPENVLFVVGDLSALRIRAEIEERDIGKIRVGQKVLARTDAFPGETFTGKVDKVARALGPPQIPNKGRVRLADREVLQVLINLDARTTLLPGMRVDVFFQPDKVGANATEAVKTN